MIERVIGIRPIPNSIVVESLNGVFVRALEIDLRSVMQISEDAMRRESYDRIFTPDYAIVLPEEAIDVSRKVLISGSWSTIGY